jgi:hypothetical protein
MNRKAIEIALADGVDLAWNNRLSLGRDQSLGQRSLVRVRVLAVDLDRPVPDGTPFYRHAEHRKRIVRIQIVDVSHDRGTDAGQVGEKLWIEPRFLVDTWAAYDDAREMCERLKIQHAEIAEQKDAKVARDVAELTNVLQRHGLRPNGVKRTPAHYSLEDSTAVITLTLAEVKLLVGEADSLT